MKLINLIKLTRPSHLVGNFLIFSIGTAIALKFRPFALDYFTGLISFLLCYGGVYAFNDLIDAESDKYHEIEWKRNRPLPQGLVGKKEAIVEIIMLFTLGLILGSFSRILLPLILLIVLNILYTLKLKKEPIIGLIFVGLFQAIKIYLENGVEKEKIPKAWKVKIVSSQSNFPAPNMILTICARKTMKVAEKGIIKKIILLKVCEKFLTNSFLLFFDQEQASEGKAATAKDIPIIPKGTLWILLAKLNIAKLPAAKVEATTVTTKKLIWETAKPIVLGIIRKTTFLKSELQKFILNLNFRPHRIDSGSWIKR